MLHQHGISFSPHLNSVGSHSPPHSIPLACRNMPCSSEVTRQVVYKTTKMKLFNDSIRFVRTDTFPLFPYLLLHELGPQEIGRLSALQQ